MEVTARKPRSHGIFWYRHFEGVKQRISIFTTRSPAVQFHLSQKCRLPVGVNPLISLILLKDSGKGGLPSNSRAEVEEGVSSEFLAYGSHLGGKHPLLRPVSPLAFPNRLQEKLALLQNVLAEGFPLQSTFHRNHSQPAISPSGRLPWTHSPYQEPKSGPKENRKHPVQNEKRC